MAFNVLVVDDSTVMRHMIVKSLHMCRLPIEEIYQASNGKEGLDVLEKKWVDLVLMDINMPVMNGEEMFYRIRENADTRSLPVIIISSEASKARIESFARAGAGFVHKPFTPEKLKETIRKTFEKVPEV